MLLLAKISKIIIRTKNYFSNKQTLYINHVTTTVFNHGGVAEIVFPSFQSGGQEKCIS